MPPRKAKSKAAVATATASPTTTAASGSRFKILKVTERTSIRNFVEKHKLKFEAGKGFYQLTKPELIQFYKEVVVRRRKDGVVVSGDEVSFIILQMIACRNSKHLSGLSPTLT